MMIKDNYFINNGRNPERIKEILLLLEKYWSKHPDLRFFQMLDSLGFRSEDDYFYTEDLEIIKKLLDNVEDID